MGLNASSFVDLEYFNIMSGLAITAGSSEEIIFNNFANSVINNMEYFCSRKLKEKEYSSTDEEDEDFTIFDGIQGTTFWFPTYPISELTLFSISGVTISPSTAFDDSTGYFLNKKMGKLVYFGGFDYGYLQNIKADYTGGYNSESLEYAELQVLSYEMISDLYNNKNESNNSELISEKIGGYSYTRAKPKELEKYQGMFPDVFSKLYKYKRFIIQ
jgi:hypothetical protein